MPRELAPPLLCPYCGHDWTTLETTRCPHCQRAVVALRWVPLAPPRRALRTVYFTLLLILVVTGAALLAGAYRGFPPPPGLLALVGALALVVGAAWLYEVLRGPRAPREWSFTTGEGWGGIVRFDGRTRVYACGHAVVRAESVPCAPPPAECAALSYSSMRALDAAGASEALRLVSGVTVPGPWDPWLAAYAALVGLAARGGITLHRQRVSLVGWSRERDGAPVEDAAAHSVEVTAVRGGGTREREGAWEQRVLAAMDSRARAGGEGAAHYRDAGIPDDHAVADLVTDVVSMERDAGAVEATADTTTEGVLPALRAFVEHDRDLARRLWDSLVAPEEGFVDDDRA